MQPKQPMRRVAILATLGAEPHRFGIDYEHRDAWRGVLAMPVAHFMSLLGSKAEEAGLLVGEALARLVVSDVGPLFEFGSAVLHERGAEKYKITCASWEAQTEEVKGGRWRFKTPSREQGLLMCRIAQHLGVPLPSDLNRGQAADWITAQGGNPRYRNDVR